MIHTATAETPRPASSWWLAAFKKETLQLFPMAAVIAVAMLLISSLVAIALPPATINFWKLDRLPFGIPILFAVGCGGMSITRQKESRSLGLLSWLPVSPASLVLVKWLVALAILWVIWAAVLLIAAPTSSSTGAFSFTRMFPQSIFLLSLSMACAWKLRDGFAALTSIVPLALVPFLCSQGIIWCMQWASGRDPLHAEQAAVHLLVLWLAIPVTMIAMFIGGKQALSRGEVRWLPQIRSRSSDALSVHGDSGRRGTTTLDESPYLESASWRDRFSSPADALLWQSTTQNQKLFWGLSVIGIVLPGIVATMALLSAADDFSRRGNGQLEFWVITGGLLACMAWSWLGVMTSSGQNDPKALRLLSQIGIAPTRVWWTRWLPVASMAALALVVYAIVAQTLPRLLDTAVMLPSWFAMLILLPLVLGLSAWIGTVLRPLPAAIVLAPIASTLFVGLCTSTLDQHSSHAVWFMMAVVTLWVSLWRLQCLQYDGQRRGDFWATAGIAFLLIVGLPMVPTGIQAINASTHPNSASWLAEARRTPNATGTQVFDWKHAKQNDVLGNTFPRSFETIVQEHRQRWGEFGDAPAWLSRWQEVSVDSVAPPSDFDVEAFLGLLNWRGLMLRQASNERVNVEAFESQLRQCSEAVMSLRKSNRWGHHELADWMEIAMVGWLKEARENIELPTDFAFDVRKRLADAQARDQARRRAVLKSYQSTRERMAAGKSPRFRDSLGVEQSMEGTSFLIFKRVARSNLDAITGNLLRLVQDDADPQTRDSARAALHDLLVDSAIPLESGPYAKVQRVDDATIQLAQRDVMLRFPGTQVGGRWQRQAQDMLPKRKQPMTKQQRAPENAND